MQTSLTRSLSPSTQKVIAFSLLAVSFIVITWFIYAYLPVDVGWERDGAWSIGVDWKGALRPAVFRTWSGESPYGHAAFNPPWVYVLLAPVALLPEALGAAVMYALGLFAFGLAAYRYGAKPWMAALFITTPFVLGNSNNGNIDWMVAIGATLPPQLGLFLVLAKPQIGAGLVLFWLVEAWREGGTKQVVRVFTPVGVAFLASFALYGLWPLQAGDLTGVWWNASLWPASIPIGLALLASAIRSRKAGLSITSSPFLSPYLTEHSWALALFGLMRDPFLFALAVVGTWIARFV